MNKTQMNITMTLTDEQQEELIAFLLRRNIPHKFYEYVIGMNTEAEDDHN